MMRLPAGRHVGRLGDLPQDVAEVDDGVAGLAEPPIRGAVRDPDEIAAGDACRAVTRAASQGFPPAPNARHRQVPAILAPLATLSARPQRAALGREPGLPVGGCRSLDERPGALAGHFSRGTSGLQDIVAIVGTGPQPTHAAMIAQAVAAEAPSGASAQLRLAAGRPFADDVAVAADCMSFQRRLGELRGRGVRSLTLDGADVSPSLLPGLGLSFDALIFVGNDQDAVAAPSPDAQQLLRALAPSGWLIVDLDRPQQVAGIRALAPAVPTLGFTRRGASATAFACDILLAVEGVEPHPGGMRLTLACRRDDQMTTAECAVTLVGETQISALLAAVGLLLSRGRSLSRAVAEARQFRAAPGHRELFGNAGTPRVLVDVARDAQSLSRLLTDARGHGYQRLLTVIGGQAGCTPAARAALGAAAAQGSDLVVLTDADPGSESAADIVTQVRSGMGEHPAVRIARQRGVGGRIAIALAGREDLVVIAGRGARRLQDLGECQRRFSDRAQVVEALRECREGQQ